MPPLDPPRPESLPVPHKTRSGITDAQQARPSQVRHRCSEWQIAQPAKPSRNYDLAKAINYMLRRLPAFERFLADGRICISNNAAERALRCVPMGRKAWLFCASDRGGQRAAILYTLIQPTRLHNSCRDTGSIRPPRSPLG